MDPFDAEAFTKRIDKLKMFLRDELKTFELLVSGAFDDILPRSTEREIYQLIVEGKNSKAAKTFLKTFNDSSVTGKWGTLQRELLKPEHELVYEVLFHAKIEYLDNHYYWGKIFNMFKENLVDQVETAVAVEHCEKDLLTKSEAEEIRCLRENKGNRYAAYRLLMKVPSNKDWFPIFLKILWDMDKKELVKLLDPDAYEKIASQKSFDPKCASRLERMHIDEDGTEEAPVLNIQGECSNTCQIEGGAPGGPGIMERDAVPDALPQIKQEDETLLKTTMFNETSAEYSSDVYLPREENPVLNKLNDKTQLKVCTQTPSLNVFEEEKKDYSNLPQPPPSGAVVQDKPIELRNYQKELAEDAVNGKNVIICAPTGSGKTIVAIQIMAKHLEKAKGKRNPKIIFLVNNKALAEQQYKNCKKYLGTKYECFLINGDTELKVPFNRIVMKYDILILTVQILIDAFDPSQNQMESIRHFSLLIFDECHHAKDQHPFNKIMLKYMNEKYPDVNRDPERIETNLPQIVGLTASTGVGKATSDQKAIDFIFVLCANLDADMLCTVERNRFELQEYTHCPNHEIVSCPTRTNDEFKKILNTMMINIEQDMMQKLIAAQCYSEVPHFPSRDSPAYTQWISNMKNKIAKLGSDDVERELESARRYLEAYHIALTINEDCRTVDANTYLQDKFHEVLQTQGNLFIPYETALYEHFEKHKSQLDGVATGLLSANPKLDALQKQIYEAYRVNADSRVIVFVKTRELAGAVERWMRETSFLKDLKPGRMVGGAPSEKGGMTKGQQSDVLENFRKGIHKLLVATSVAQEGLDIAECNLVIQYNYNTNEIAMVQARGRARAENSQYAVIAAENSSVQQKEELNIVREVMMNIAIETLKGEICSDSEQYARRKKKHQQEILLKTIFDQERACRADEINFTCVKCSKFGCSSSDVRKIRESHHIVVDPDFGNRIDMIPCKRVAYGDTENQGKMLCTNCGEHWGLVIRYRNHCYPVMRITSFKIVNNLGVSKVVKKWKQVGVFIKPLDQNEEIANVDEEFGNLRGFHL